MKTKIQTLVIFVLFLAFSTNFGRISAAVTFRDPELSRLGEIAATMLRDPELSKLGEIQTKYQRICDLVPSACGHGYNDDSMQKRGILDLMNSWG